MNVEEGILGPLLCAEAFDNVLGREAVLFWFDGDANQTFLSNKRFQREWNTFPEETILHLCNCLSWVVIPLENSGGYVTDWVVGVDGFSLSTAAFLCGFELPLNVAVATLGGLALGADDNYTDFLLIKQWHGRVDCVVVNTSELVEHIYCFLVFVAHFSFAFVCCSLALLWLCA